MDLELEGKVALVTGGNRNIGKAIAKELARNGADIAIAARDLAALEAAAGEISRKTGRKVLFFQADLSHAEAIKQLAKDVVEAFGRIDILVNGAARRGTPAPGGAATSPSDEQILEDFTVKALGYLRLSRTVAPYMKQQGWGRIINISGMGALTVGNLSTSIRNVSVVTITKTLANELGPYGINVTAIHPDNVYTESFAERFGAIAQQQGITLEEYARQMGERNAIRRLVTAEDIAYVVAFLASPKATAICGETIVVNGGAGTTIRY